MGGVVNRKTISPTEYQKKMDKIIKMRKPVAHTLIEMLEEAGKYNICDKNTLSALRKRDKEGIKSQKHIFKEWDKKRGVPRMGTLVPFSGAKLSKSDSKKRKWMR
jgi:hypothetical protein